MKYLYHLTKPEYLDQILSEGLKPIIGDNSKFVGDMTPASHMSERKYLPYWNLLLDKPGVLLKIDTSYLCKDKLLERNYQLYKEKMYGELIPKEAVSVAKGINLSLGNLDVVSRQEFKLSIINGVNRICELIARLASDPENEYYLEGYEDAKLCATTSRKVLSLADYAEITPKKLKDELIFLAENCGAYTLCDVDYANFDGSMRLYEHLHRKPYATEDTKWLYDWLVSNYSSVLDTDTGGWGW